jgi:hypothetical protein
MVNDVELIKIKPTKTEILFGIFCLFFFVAKNRLSTCHGSRLWRLIELPLKKKHFFFFFFFFFFKI